jgi:hypothetical protein
MAKQQYRSTLVECAEDLEYKIMSAGVAAVAVANSVNNGTNPQELVSAWMQVETDLRTVLERVKKLAC